MKEKGFALPFVLVIFTLVVVGIGTVVYFQFKPKSPLQPQFTQSTKRIPSSDIVQFGHKLSFLRGGEVWLFDQGKEVQLTNTKGKIKEFKWAPDGKTLFYIRTKQIKLNENDQGLWGSPTIDIGNDIVKFDVDSKTESTLVTNSLPDEKLSEFICPAGCGVFINETRGLEISDNARYVYYIRNSIFRTDLSTRQTIGLPIKPPARESNEFFSSILVSPQQRWLIVGTRGHEFKKNQIVNLKSNKNIELGYEARLGSEEPLKIPLDFLSEDELLIAEKNYIPGKESSIKIKNLMNDNLNKTVNRSDNGIFYNEFCGESEAIYSLYRPNTNNFQGLSVISVPLIGPATRKELLNLEAFSKYLNNLGEAVYLYEFNLTPDCKAFTVIVGENSYNSKGKIWVFNFDGSQQENLGIEGVSELPQWVPQ